MSRSQEAAGGDTSAVGLLSMPSMNLGSNSNSNGREIRDPVKGSTHPGPSRENQQFTSASMASVASIFAKSVEFKRKDTFQTSLAERMRLRSVAALQQIEGIREETLAAQAQARRFVSSARA